MEKGQLIETYRILKESKWSGLKQETKTALIDDMSRIRSIVKEYEEMVNDVREKLKPDGFAGMIDLMNLDRSGERKMDAGKKLSYNRIMADYQQQVNTCLKAALSEEVDIDLKPVTFDELNILCDSNDLKGVDMECLYVLIH